MVYNAIAEQNINNLIKQASQNRLSEGAITLQQALKYLNQEFGASHCRDLPKHDVERLQVRKKLSEAIISTYDNLIRNFIKTDYGVLLTEKEKLGSELSRAEELKETYRTDLEEAEKQRKELERKVGELEEKVNGLTSEIADLNEAQQDFRDI